ncbi:chromosomal replication initiator protein DnaA [Candidatus Mycoplasma mahonii]|uniref:chromosomal replication initiator protein DnaA n=1 Tax=Candidatus Mycoplasma mahonii TaxID=3004105 RepID=UPI0026EB8727|nr:chromosomal replication initiator protein DnaA [Candidatus Mycoplasma mahonii]WKX02484.1 chromosomal replication initiator protein DnaA [Candidatus Mycoplasma mahonii]
MKKENSVIKTSLSDQTNTSLLVEYLEAIVADEMILNSFIRDLKLFQINETKVSILVSSYRVKILLLDTYMEEFQSGIDQIFEKKMDITFNVASEVEYIQMGEKTISKSMYISEKLTFKNYVTSTFNETTVNVAKKLSNNPGIFSPLFITSSSGLGKTHLLHAIANDFLDKGFSAAYIEPNNFTRTIRELSREGGDAISKFIDSMVDFDILLFDDIQYLGDRQVTLKVLFNIINYHTQNKKQIVVVSDKTPQELSGFEERFVTRFVSGLTEKIHFPEIEDLMKILKFKLKEQKLKPDQWEKEALKFVARNNSSSIRSIEGAVKRVVFFTMSESNIKYTYTVISSIFKELTIDPSELTPQRIINVVAKYYKIPKKVLMSKSRKKDVAFARQMTMWLVRSVLKKPYKEIGNIFNRDHSTVISAVQNIETSMKLNSAVKSALNKLESNINTVK